MLLAGCSPAEQPAASEPLLFEVVGSLENPKIDEASALARSQREPGVLWTLNDDGKARLFAIDGAGRDRGDVDLKGADNDDWEDLASFTLAGDPYLVVADIGTVEAQHVAVALVEHGEQSEGCAIAIRRRTGVRDQPR